MARKTGKEERLEQTVAALQTRFGARAIQRGVAQTGRVVALSTGFRALDKALGIGGIPRGRIAALTGSATSGKRTLAALLLAQAQGGRGRPVVYVDAARTCDAEYLARCGVDLDGLLVVRPRDGREALDALVEVAGRKEWAAVVVDYWGAVVGEGGMRRTAAGALDQVVGSLARSGGTVVVLEEGETRGWVGRLMGEAEGVGEWAAIRLALRRERWLEVGRDVRGYRVEVTVVKNKLGPSGATVGIEIRFNGTVRGEGI